MIYERQTPEIQKQIRDAIIDQTTPFFQSGDRTIPAPAVRIRAEKR